MIIVVKGKRHSIIYERLVLKMDYKFITNRVAELTSKTTEHQIVPKGKRKLNAIIVGDSKKIRPSFYVENYGLSTEEEIANAIAEEYENLPQNIDVPDLLNFETMKEKIIPCFTTENGFVDENIIVKHFMADIDVYYRIMIDDLMSVIISKKLLNSWNCSEEKLHNLAMTNLANLDISFGKFFCCDDMFVLTTKMNDYGANVLLDTAKLESIRCEIGDFYVLPSSVHEVICIPISEENKDHISVFKSTVHEVNSTLLAEDEMLSENVYVFDDNGLNIA